MSAGADVAIESPLPDSLAASAIISVGGSADARGGTVRVQVETEPAVDVGVTGGQWWVSGVLLPDVLNVVTATMANAHASALVTRATGITERGSQRVYIHWATGTAAELEQIAVGTLQAPLTAQERNAFVASTRLQTGAIIASNFSRFAIEIAEEPGPDTHVIEFLPLAGSQTYGQTATDCLNQSADGSSQIWVGTLRSTMVSNLASWAPMKPTDSLAVRIADVAHALARTASHELGHGLGLVTGSMPAACQWMNGCDLDHNCQGFDALHPLADRFDKGRYIMDPGPRTANVARIAEASPQVRGPRVPATFNAFNSAYLAHLHPL